VAVASDDVPRRRLADDDQVAGVAALVPRDPPIVDTTRTALRAFSPMTFGTLTRRGDVT
jgi:hypothetical protein